VRLSCLSKSLLLTSYRAAIARGQSERGAERSKTQASDAASIDTVLNRPQSRGSVSLRSADPHELPLVDGRWLSHPDDVASQVSGIKKIQELLVGRARLADKDNAFSALVETVVSPGCVSLSTSAARATVAGDSDAELEAYVRAQQQSTWHYSCTARMGRADDASSVTGSTGLVRGVHGLRYCHVPLRNGRCSHVPLCNG